MSSWQQAWGRGAIRVVTIVIVGLVVLAGTGQLAAPALVISGNHNPIANPDSESGAHPGVPFNIYVVGNDSDPDGDQVMVVNETLATTAGGQAKCGAIFIDNQEFSTSGYCIYRAPAGSGTDTFTYHVTDGRGGAASATVTVTYAPNHAPVAHDDNVDARSDITNSVFPTTNDTDEDDEGLYVARWTEAQHGHVDCGEQYVCRYRPAPGYLGSDSFTYVVTDGNGGEATATVHLTVLANHRPSAVDDSFNVTAGASRVMRVLNNDTDPDFDSLVVESWSQPTTGSVTCDTTTCTYQAPAGTGTAAFTYTASDQRGDTSTATVHMTIQATNHTPVAVNDSYTVHVNSFESLDVLANDSDADGDPLDLQLESSPSFGFASCSFGSCVYSSSTPGSTSFTYRVDDGRGGTAVGTVSVTVASNRPPTALNDFVTAKTAVSTTIAVMSNDSDPENNFLRIVRWTQGDQGGTVACGDFTCEYRSRPFTAGTEIFSYTISDGQDEDSGDVYVSLSSDANPPFAFDDNLAVDTGKTKAVKVLANDYDPDSDDLVIERWGQGTHGAVSCTNVPPDYPGESGSARGSTCSYTAELGYTGADQFGYTISDGRGLEASALVNVTVRPQDQAPTANPDSLTIRSGSTSSYDFDVRNNDVDPDQDPLSVLSWTPPSHGTVKCLYDGGYPDYLCQDVAYRSIPGYVGPDGFSYTIDDGRDGEATAAVTVDVTPNQAPAAVTDDISIKSELRQAIYPTSNDTDPEFDSLVVVRAGNGAHGTTECDWHEGFYAAEYGSYACFFTPAHGFVGGDEITYVISDQHGAEATGTAHIAVLANHPPVAVDDELQAVTETVDVVFPMRNDSDPDNYVAPTYSADPLTIIRWSQSQHAVSVTCFPPDSNDTSGYLAHCDYQPDAQFVGPDSFTYTLSDGRGGEATGTVHVQVRGSNLPTPADDNLTVRSGATADINVVQNDSDPDGDHLTVVNWSPGTTPFQGDVAQVVCNWFDGNVQRLGHCLYTARPGYSGSDQFAYQVTDGRGGYVTATVNVTVTPDQPPTPADDHFDVKSGLTVTVRPTLNDTDPDDDPAVLVVTGAGSPQHGHVSCFGAVCQYRSETGYTGADQFTYTADDQHGGHASATAFLNVLENHSPVAVDDGPVSVDYEGTATRNVVNNDIDTDDDALTVLDASGTTALNGSYTCSFHSCSYTAPPGFSGADSFDYTVSDGRGGTDVGTVSVSVRVPNRAPVAVTDSLTVKSDTSGGSVDVLANDTDADGDTLKITAIGGQQQFAHVGCPSAFGSGVCSYQPAPGFAGPDHFDYTIIDGHGGTGFGRVEITVTANLTPTAVDDALVAEYQQPASVNVVANDSDPEGDPNLSVLRNSQSERGGAVTCGGASCTYTSGGTTTGPDRFSYVLTDGRGGEATATVNVTVKPPPVAQLAIDPDKGLASREATLTVTALAKGVPAEATDTLTYRIDWGDGQSSDWADLSEAGVALQHGYTRPDTYLVTLFVKNQRGGIGLDTRALRVDPLEPLVAVINGDDQSLTVDKGLIGRFDASASRPPSGIDSYDWDFGGGAIDAGRTEPRASHIFDDAGTRTVTLTIHSGGLTDTDTIKVVVGDTPVDYGLFVTTTIDGTDQPLSEVQVIVKDSDGNTLSDISDADGHARIRGLADGQYAVYAWRDADWLPNVATLTVSAGVGQGTIGLKEGKIVSTTLESKRLTIDEIKAKGIDVNDPANQNVFQFNIRLAFQSTFFDVGGNTNDRGEIVGNDGFLKSGDDPPRPYSGTAIPLGGGLEATPKPGKTPEGHHFIVWVVVPAKASFLKEFFSVKLVINNLAPEGFTFTGGQASLQVPDGLSLPDLTGTEQLDTQPVPDIPGLGSASVEWILRGDKEGDYFPTAKYLAVVEPVHQPVTADANLAKPLHVYGGSALKMTVMVEDQAVNDYPVHLRIKLKNVTSDAPVGSPGTELEFAL